MLLWGFCPGRGTGSVSSGLIVRRSEPSGRAGCAPRTPVPWPAIQCVEVRRAAHGRLCAIFLCPGAAWRAVVELMAQASGGARQPAVCRVAEGAAAGFLTRLPGFEPGFWLFRAGTYVA